MEAKKGYLQILYSGTDQSTKHS